MNPTAVTHASGTGPPRFVRRTVLRADEFRKNFHQVDADVIAAVTSAEADRVTPLMSKIYLRLVSAPAGFWEREGVLYFAAGNERGQPVKASKVLYGLLGVASATAHKALTWMHGQGIIGYFAGKNGAGIRIFLNRAAGSIGVRAPGAGKKILPFARGSNGEIRGSGGEPAFNDSFAVSEVLDADINPPAPENGAEQTEVVKTAPDPHPAALRHPTRGIVASERVPLPVPLRVELPVEEIVSRLRCELEPSLRSSARQAAAQEHERTREWLESRGLPKAARVAQREAFNVLRQHGLVGKSPHTRAGLDVRRQVAAPDVARPLSPEEVRELAETCAAMLEVHGQAIEVTLAELSAEAGGVLPAEDAPKVRKLAEAMAYAGGKE
ncbi:MAG: hypothetical protein M3416_05135 [Acidobacteriota bacterium]|nr:hypothetical protein [Acidobacteriota bacterium]